MGDINLVGLGDDDDLCTITKQEYDRFRATWPVKPGRPLCHFCGSPLKGRRWCYPYCSRRCKQLDHRARPIEEIEPSGGVL